MDFAPDRIAVSRDELKQFFLEFCEEQKTANLASKKKQPLPSRDFHGYPEIRWLITANLDKLKAELDYEPFKIEALIHCLRKLATLRPDDLQLLSDGKIRFDSQVSGALSNWDKNPLKRETHRSSRLYWKALND